MSEKNWDRYFVAMEYFEYMGRGYQTNCWAQSDGPFKTMGEARLKTNERLMDEMCEKHPFLLEIIKILDKE